MNILFVFECSNLETNGTTATCNRFAHELRKKGHTVRILSIPHPLKNPEHYFNLKPFHFPIFQGLIEKEGFSFAKLDYEVIYQAVKWADVVHLFLPFKLSNVARIMAEAEGKAVTSAYHLQPQNVTSALHMGYMTLINNALYAGFRDYLYVHTRHVHCPSEMIANQLKEHKYVNNVTHVISNGVIPFFHHVDSEKPEAYKDKFVVTMSGRLAKEKRQDLIIKAIASSKYNKDIQLVLCGQGPLEKRYRRLAHKKGLANPIQIHFCNQEELRNVLCYSDLYVHASDFEIEGISAIEAITCGAVPLISDSKLSATNDFSLDDEHCIFKHGCVASLREKIEYLYEHPELRKELSKRYEESAPQFALKEQVDRLEKMFEIAIEETKEKKDIPNTIYCKADHKRAKKIYSKLIKKGIVDSLPQYCLK